jgi:hypothetical protein
LWKPNGVIMDLFHKLWFYSSDQMNKFIHKHENVS